MSNRRGGQPKKSKKSGGDSPPENVMVVVRGRPMLDREKQANAEPCLDFFQGKQVTVGEGKPKLFYHAFGPYSKQVEIYNRCVASLVDACFEGYNATVFAYGQTGSGKTYTMGTSNDESVPEEYLGIIPRVVDALFSRIADETSKDCQFSVHVSYMEIYREELVDLLNPDRDEQLVIREEKSGEMTVGGVREIRVQNFREMMTVFSEGNAGRSTGSTLMNEQSSRSHSIFSILLETTRRRQQGGRGVERRRSKFHLVDLAGSERNKKTQATGSTFKEAISINKGLLALGNVISALGQSQKRRGHVHIPYRNSVLTRLLQDSLGGNSRTLMIACLAPSTLDMDETSVTLQYAARASLIKNKAVLNLQLENPYVEDLTRLREELRVLQKVFDRSAYAPSPEAAMKAYKIARRNERMRKRAERDKNSRGRGRQSRYKKPKSAAELPGFKEFSIRQALKSFFDLVDGTTSGSENSDELAVQQWPVPSEGRLPLESLMKAVEAMYQEDQKDSMYTPFSSHFVPSKATEATVQPKTDGLIAPEEDPLLSLTDIALPEGDPASLSVEDEDACCLPLFFSPQGLGDDAKAVGFLHPMHTHRGWPPQMGREVKAWRSESAETVFRPLKSDGKDPKQVAGRLLRKFDLMSMSFQPPDDGADLLEAPEPPKVPSDRLYTPRPESALAYLYVFVQRPLLQLENQFRGIIQDKEWWADGGGKWEKDADSLPEELREACAALLMDIRGRLDLSGGCIELEVFLREEERRAKLDEERAKRESEASRRRQAIAEEKARKEREERARQEAERKRKEREALEMKQRQAEEAARRQRDDEAQEARRLNLMEMAAAAAASPQSKTGGGDTLAVTGGDESRRPSLSKSIGGDDSLPLDKLGSMSVQDDEFDNMWEDLEATGVVAKSVDELKLDPFLSPKKTFGPSRAQRKLSRSADTRGGPASTMLPPTPDTPVKSLQSTSSDGTLAMHSRRLSMAGKTTSILARFNLLPPTSALSQYSQDSGASTTTEGGSAVAPYGRSKISKPGMLTQPWWKAGSSSSKPDSLDSTKSGASVEKKAPVGRSRSGSVSSTLLWSKMIQSRSTGHFYNTGVVRRSGSMGGPDDVKDNVADGYEDELYSDYDDEAGGAGADGSSANRTPSPQKPGPSKPQLPNTPRTPGGNWVPEGVKPSSSIHEEHEVWEQVNQLRKEAKNKSVEQSEPEGSSTDRGTPIAYLAAERWLRDGSRMDPLRSEVLANEKQRSRGKKAGWRARLKKKSLANSALIREKEDILCLTNVSLKVAKHLVHERMLQTVYRNVTGSTKPVGRIGSHWERIGFQSADPSSDLRAAGIFGLLQWLWLSENHPSLMSRVYTLSMDRLSEFPMAVIGMNFSGMVVSSLRSGMLHKYCNRFKSTFLAANNLYAGLWFSFVTQWQDGNCSISDWDRVKKSLEMELLESVGTFIKELQAHAGVSLNGVRSSGSMHDVSSLDAGESVPVIAAPR